MNFWRRIFFEWMYFHSPPWDSGIVPPEVIEFVAHHPPGRGIDLGCGTGTNAIYLAKNGWQVIGVDFSRKALTVAKRKNKHQGTNVRFIHDDVSTLQKINGGFDLVLDIGCFHGLSPAQKQSYLRRVKELLFPDGYFLLYGFIQSPPDKPSILPEDIKEIQAFMEILGEKLGEDKGRKAAWFLIRNNKTSSDSQL